MKIAYSVLCNNNIIYIYNNNKEYNKYYYNYNIIQGRIQQFATFYLA